MQVSRLMAVVVLGLTIAGCSGNGGPATAEFTKEDNAAVRQLVQDFATTYNAKEPAKVAALFAGSGVMMPPDTSTLRGAESIAGFFEDRFAQGATNLVVEAKELNGVGTMAIMSGPYTVDVVAPEGGATTHQRGKTLWIVEKLGGKWLIQHLMWNSDMPPPPTPPPADEKNKTEKK